MADTTDVHVPRPTAGPLAGTAVPVPGMSARDRTVIAVLLVSTFVMILNETVMSVALPVLMVDLRVAPTTGQWLTAGFLLTMSVVIPVTGFLIRRVATRTLYATAMAVFSAGTLAAALAPGFPVLLSARVVQACGTAIMLPLLMTTVMTLVPPARRGAVMGNISIVISVAPAVGPVLSGVLLDVVGWRSLFWVVLPIALVALLVGARLVSDVGERSADPVDVLSVPLSALGFGGVVFGLSSVGQGTGGGSQASAVVAFVVGAVGLALFGARQVRLQRQDRALLDLRVFRAGTFTTATVLMVVMMVTLFGTIVILPIYTQRVLGLSPLTTGLLLLPGGLLMGLLAPFVGRLYDRVGARPLLLPGAAAASAALWTSTRLDAGSSLGLVLGLYLLLSAGLAFVFTPLFTAGLSALPAPLYAHGSAIFATTQQLAGAAGVALLVSVLSARAADLAGAGARAVEATAAGVHSALVLAAVLSVLAVAGAAFVHTPPAPAGGGAPVAD